MSDIDDLKSLLGDPSNIASLAETLGASEDDTRQAVAAAVPALLGGLAMQADDPERSAGLEQALENDHSGDIFGQLDALLGGTGSGKQFDGAEGERGVGAVVLPIGLHGRRHAAIERIDPFMSIAESQVHSTETRRRSASSIGAVGWTGWAVATHFCLPPLRQKPRSM